MNQIIGQHVNYQTLTGTALCSLLLLVLAGCGSNTLKPEHAQLRASEPISLSYEVQKGDSLAMIAKRLTGDEENWSEIASVNGIDNPRRLRVGMVLMVPEYLIPEFGETSASQPLALARSGGTADANPNSTAIAASVETVQPTPIRKRSAVQQPPANQADWIFQASSLPGVLDAPVVVHRADANRNFEVERVSIADTDPQQTTAGSNQSGQSVRVIGSYFPKGIYTQPSYTSELLMRVAPGSRFELEQSFGDWLQIRTEKGSGYIRSTDAEILSAIESDEVLFSNNV